VTRHVFDPPRYGRRVARFPYEALKTEADLEQRMTTLEANTSAGLAEIREPLLAIDRKVSSRTGFVSGVTFVFSGMVAAGLATLHALRGVEMNARTDEPGGGLR
jgi:hypothetical protein